MGIPSQWNMRVGILPTGCRNLLSDVSGVTVGHHTLDDGETQTGVTAVLPHGGNIFLDKVMASCHVINGFGKSMGLVQIEELGTIETPIVLTNTLSAGTAYTAVVKHMLRENPDIGRTTGTVNPVICECNDGYINDIRALRVEESHVQSALADAKADFAEGAVGAGRGMSCHEMNGGIGSASRVVTLDGKEYTVGALLMTNHALFRDLTILGDAVGRNLQSVRKTEKDKGSCIVLLATDAPMNERQLRRLCRRAVTGLSRTGSYMANGSGEIAIAFSTANRVPHYANTGVLPLSMIWDESMDDFFRAAAEVVEESVLSSMLHSQTMTGFQGRRLLSLSTYLQITDK